MATRGVKWGESSSSSSSAAPSSKMQWGDVDGDDDGPVSPSGADRSSSSSSSAVAPVVPVVSQSKVDAKGIKTVVEFGTNAQGEKIRITRKIKVSASKQRAMPQLLCSASAAAPPFPLSQ